MTTSEHSMGPSSDYRLAICGAGEAVAALRDFTHGESPINSHTVYELIKSLPDNVDGLLARETFLTLIENSPSISDEQTALIGLGIVAQALVGARFRETIGE